MVWWGLRMTTPLTLTRPARIHCLARFFGVSGCFRSNQSNRGPVLVPHFINTTTFAARDFWPRRGARDAHIFCTGNDVNNNEAQGLWHGADYGPKARFIPAWANGPGHRHTQTLSAKGAIRPSGIIRDGAMNGAGPWDVPGFQPSLCLRCIAWGVAPGWDDGAPLALTEDVYQSGCRSTQRD